MSPNLDLQRAFASALRIRMVEQRIADIYSEGKMRCPVHLSIGQEIPSAIFEQIHRPGDSAISTHRAHAHYLAKGGHLPRMIAEIYGKVTGCSRGRGGSMHLVDLDQGFFGSSAIVGNSIPIGVGVAFAMHLDANSAVSYVFLGDGAVEEGVFFEAANFASIHKLPVVFVVENNRYSVYTNLNARQPQKRSIAKLAASIGLKSEETIDSDFANLFETFHGLSQHSREGKGASLLEIHTYRKLEHCGPNDDDHLGYRPEGELRLLKEIDLVEDLRSRAEITSDELQSLVGKFNTEIDDAFKFADESSFPEYSEILRSVYAD